MMGIACLSERLTVLHRGFDRVHFVAAAHSGSRIPAIFTLTAIWRSQYFQQVPFP